MKRVAIKIAYLGRDYSGSQYQPGLKTVVGDVYSDLESITKDVDRKWFDLKVASRTDAGVNALDNVIVFNTKFDNVFVLLDALNGVSRRIFYKSVAEVDRTFNPRFADFRTYKYNLYSEGIDFNKVVECSKLFVGKHNFVKFCKSDARNTVLSIEYINVSRIDGFIVLTFRSRCFLWNMIRRIMSAVESVGKGMHSLNDIKDALNGENINFGMARPDALTLAEVSYNNVKFLYSGSKQYYKRLKEERLRNALESSFFSQL
ncbi:MAG: tRNA pseudouridine(38-40) synthase TruA [archaeon]|nr:tRNA pseudouridine(38-40) synthase TruA [archaeon]